MLSPIARINTRSVATVAVRLALLRVVFAVESPRFQLDIDCSSAKRIEVVRTLGQAGDPLLWKILIADGE